MESYLYLGRAYEATGDYNYAANVYNSYLEKYEGNAEMYNQLGLCEMTRGEYGKALEAFQAAANGKATKIIIPSELQGIAGLAAAAKTVFDTEDPKATITKTVPKQ